MSIITAENAPIIQSLLQSVNMEKPNEGQIVKIMFGKRIGKIGVVKKHMRSRFVNPYRYGSEMQHYMTDARGRWGFVVLVECEGEKAFWVDADKVMNCCTKEWK